MNTATPIQPGEVLAGKFRVDRVLGVGGMGIVVAATHLQLEKRVALKFMLEETSKNEELALRFSREARAAAKLKSEHVASVLDVGELENGAPFMVMEYLEGQDLKELVLDRVKTSGRPLEALEACSYILQACLGMAEAHCHGIIHRDLKPPNLFLTARSDGSPLIKVLDFGIAKADTDTLVTTTEAMLGTPNYMPPEQWHGAGNVDVRSDVWGLGAILHFLLTGKAPFHAESLPALYIKVANEPPRAISPEWNVPIALEQVVDACLAKAPGERPQSVAELARLLEPFGGPHAAEYVRKSKDLLWDVSPTNPTLPTRPTPPVPGLPVPASTSVPRFPVDSSLLSATVATEPWKASEPQMAPEAQRTPESTTYRAMAGEVAPETPHIKHTSSSPRSKIFLAALGALVLCGFVAVLVLRGQTKSSEKAETRPTPTNSIAPALRSIDAGNLASSPLHVNITTVPEGAQILINGAPQGVTPYKVDVERNATLWLRLELSGHEPYQKQVRIDSEDAIAITLVPLANSDGSATESAQAEAAEAEAKAMTEKRDAQRRARRNARDAKRKVNDDSAARSEDRRH